MSNCNKCGNNPCGCGRCEPARYTCGFDIQADPFDSSTWLFNFCGQTHRIKIPKISETCTNLSTNFSTSSLVYNGECGQNIITGNQIGGLINLDDLRDVESHDADSCDLLVFDPGCVECGNGCKPKPAQWRNYHIPDAGDCEIELDDEGYYKVLVKDDCGCIKECRLPVMPNGSTTVNYIRDSVPDDPDFPWYYGIYNDKINLHLAENAAQWFGKYDLKLTINYSIQVLHSTVSPNTNFRSLLVPVVEDSEINVSMFSSILQDQSTVSWKTEPHIPWGTVCLRGSMVFVVPKGKEAYLHHEFRLRGYGTGANYLTNALDGKKVPNDIAGQVDKMPYTASRLNSLAVDIEPTRGSANLTPVVDAERTQLDPAVDVYPNVG